MLGLKRLPRLNAIKIDASFIAGLGRSREDSAGVAAIIVNLLTRRNRTTFTKNCLLNSMGLPLKEVLILLPGRVPNQFVPQD